MLIKMKSTFLSLLFSILLISCTSNQNDKPKTSELSQATPVEESSKEDEQLKNKLEELSLAFSQAAQTFPSDSLSLQRFYFKTFRVETVEKMQRQIDRIKALLDEETIKKYNEVTSELKSLLQNIVETKSISKEQAERFAYLYAIYDKYSGGALFSQVFTDDDNYTLVWKSMEIIVTNSERDTCFVSSLISLDNSIRTNVELAEKTGEFVIEAIKNNPLGFLQMYSQRNEEGKDYFVRHAMLWDDPVPELISTFEEISKNSTEQANRTLAEDILTRINKGL